MSYPTDGKHSLPRYLFAWAIVPCSWCAGAFRPNDYDVCTVWQSHDRFHKAGVNPCRRTDGQWQPRTQFKRRSASQCRQGYAGGAAPAARAQAAFNIGGATTATRGYSGQPAQVYPGGAAPVIIVNLAPPSSIVNSAANIGSNAGDASATPAPAMPTIAVAPVADAGAAAGSRLGPVALGFDPRRASSDEVGNAIAKRLNRLPSLHFLTSAQVDVVGRTAVLHGRVASEHDRDLAGRVVLLEAAIDEVENRLEVGNSLPPNPPAPGRGASNEPAQLEQGVQRG